MQYRAQGVPWIYMQNPRRPSSPADRVTGQYNDAASHDIGQIKIGRPAGLLLQSTVRANKRP